MNITVRPAEKIKGVIVIPGDKSISQRALIMGAMAQGRTEIDNFLPARDVMSNLNCLKQLGVPIEINSPKEVIIHGVGLFGFKESDQILDCQNSGTSMRILPGLLAGQNFFSCLTGDESIRYRPVDRIITPLRKMGAKIYGRDDNRYPPISIIGRRLSGIRYRLPVPSAQVKTAILIAGLISDGKTIIEEEFRSRDHTERMLSILQARINFEKFTTIVEGNYSLSAERIIIPGDISSAAFFIALGLLVEGAEITISNVGLNPTRTGFLDILDKMDACLTAENLETISNEPRGTLIVEPSELEATDINGEIIPRLIDELPLLAVIASQAKGTTTVKDAKELRIKETDRIKAICTELRKMGAEINELEDGFQVNGPTKLKGAILESYSDHRIAMALAIAASIASGESTIRNAECVDISFPHFFDLLNKINTKG